MEIFKLEIRNTWKNTLAWAVMLAVILFMMLAFFPSMKSDAMQQLANAKLESMSPAVLAIFGLETIPDFSKINVYFGYIMQYFTMSLGVFCAIRGLNTLIQEETEGTIEYLYAKPVSRKQIVLQKIAANLLSFMILIGWLIAVTLASYLIFAEEIVGSSFRQILNFYLGSFFVGVIFMMIGLLLSALLKSSRQTASFAMGLVFGSFFMGILSALVKDLKALVILSPIDWVKDSGGLVIGPDRLQTTVGLAVIVLSILGALIYYQKKDLII